VLFATPRCGDQNYHTHVLPPLLFEFLGYSTFAGSNYCLWCCLFWASTFLKTNTHAHKKKKNAKLFSCIFKGHSASLIAPPVFYTKHKPLYPLLFCCLFYFVICVSVYVRVRLTGAGTNYSRCIFHCTLLYCSRIVWICSTH
jgi:hypothetical protein